MPRQETRLEKAGEISYTAIKKQGKTIGYRARTRYKDIDGVIRPVERTGKSKSIAKDRLTEALGERKKVRGSGDKLITPDTKISLLADLWLAECEIDEGLCDRSINLYRHEIEVSDVEDARATAAATKIKAALGALSIRELDTPRVDLHVKMVLAKGFRTKAKRQSIIIKGMMNLAVRHGAIEVNPVQALRPIRPKRGKTVALEAAQLTELRAQLRTWLAGKKIPGTPAFVSGAPRNAKVLQVADILLGTGARPGEALALRRCDIDTTSTPWRADIFGTIVYMPNKGYYRQDHVKTGESGKRTVHLPGFAMQVLRDLGAEDWKRDDETLIFPSRTGTPWSTNNFNRVWRQARGSSFAWVMPKTFRSTVASLIAEETDAATAGRQLGHAPGSRVTEQHYIVRPTLAPDSSAILDGAVGHESIPQLSHS